jgi:hypothetical protein
MLLAVKEPEGSAPSGRRERHDTAATYAADGAPDGGHGTPGPMPRTALTKQTNPCAARAAIEWNRARLALSGCAQRTCELSERAAVGNP